MRRTLALTSALVLPLGLALSACNEDEPTPETDTSQTPEETQETTEAAETEEADDSAAGSGDYTEAGTELGLGEAAAFSYTYGTDSTGDVEVSLDEIVQGSEADIADVENADGMVPYYLNFTVTGGAGAENLANATMSNSDFDGLLEGDQTAGSLIIMGGFEPCENDSLPDDFAEGSTAGFCVPALAPSGAEVVGAHYAKNDTDYDQFDGEPIIWRS